MYRKIGVLGGGQLGRMLGLEAPKLGIDLHFLDASNTFPAAQVSNKFVIGDFKNENDVFEFGKDKEVVTIEIENVSVAGLKKLEKEGVKVYPQSKVIEIIKDKGLQKAFYVQNQLPSSDFSLFENKLGILQAIEDETLNYPFVQKARTAGYDGKGVQIIKSEADLAKLFDVPSVIEDLVNIEKEIAVIVGRDIFGETAMHPVVEMDFDHNANLLDKLICPARIPKDVYEKAILLSEKIANCLEIIGLLAVELFWTSDNRILINEVAPRTHNSGHHTIENNYVSQFQQQLRCVSGLKVAKTEMISPAVMVNVLGEPQSKGKVTYEGLDKILEMPKIYPHIYGKIETKPYRKMGHISILNEDLDLAIENANFVKKTLKATSNDKA